MNLAPGRWNDQEKKKRYIGGSTLPSLPWTLKTKAGFNGRRRGQKTMGTGRKSFELRKKTSHRNTAAKSGG